MAQAALAPRRCLIIKQGMRLPAGSQQRSAGLADNQGVFEPATIAMPAIGTSSDVFQHRDPGLTTYRRNIAAPPLAEAMAERPSDRRKLAAADARKADAPADAVRAPGEPSRIRQDAAIPKQPVILTGELRVLYAPLSRTQREHDDRHAMITGGTVDLRA